MDAAIALYASHVDWKPEKRLRDPEVFKRFHRQNHVCVSCHYNRSVQAHHLLPRSQSGDDIAANLTALCLLCHSALHGNPQHGHPELGYLTPEIVRERIGAWLMSDAGLEARFYLIGKLGLEGSKAWAERMFGVSL